MPRPRARNYEELGRAIIDAGGRLLAAEGPQALTTRRVAAEVGVSTTAVYRLFGDKAGLALAMFLEGFDRLAETFAAVAYTDDPVVDLLGLGHAYRANARANPHLYELMFGRPIPGFTPAEEAVAQTMQTFDHLVVTVQRCIDSGRFEPADALDVALALHGLVHGLASLELRGSLGAGADADRRWGAALDASVRGYRRVDAG